MRNTERIAAQIVGMWRSRLRDNYEGDFEEWEHYSDTYGLAERLGFGSAKEAWEANPVIQGSTDPRDFKVVDGDGKAGIPFRIHPSWAEDSPDDPGAINIRRTPNDRVGSKGLVGRYTGPGKDYFTPEQRLKVDEVLAGLRDQVGKTINAEAPGIKEMAPEGLPYVAQGMLEELIEELNELV